MKKTLLRIVVLLSLTVSVAPNVLAGGGCGNAYIYHAGKPYCAANKCHVLTKSPTQYQVLYKKANCVKQSGEYYHDLTQETSRLGCC